MPWQLLSWLLAFGAQSGLLGINLWKLVQLTDLESDYVNPYDASKNCNQLVVGISWFMKKCCIEYILKLEECWGN